jgi:hypothetical protein
MSSRTEDTEETEDNGREVSVFSVLASVVTARRYASSIQLLSFKTSVSVRPLRVLSAMSPFSSGICGLGGHKPHFPELSEKPKQHLLGIDPLVEPETSSFGCISHDIITEIEDCLSEWP